MQGINRVIVPIIQYVDGIFNAFNSTALLVSSGSNATHNVVYQNEEGQWVTDLAYYSSFEKEVDGKTPESVGQFQTEVFVPSCMYQVSCSL